MKFKLYLQCISLSVFFLFGCSANPQINLVEESTPNTTNNEPIEEDTRIQERNTVKILSLGDSYTIGASVCETCRFPEQLKTQLQSKIDSSDFQLKIIARTGWTTTNLINAINTDNPDSDYDLVTLLIGVNNQFQNKQFTLYEEEFPKLVNTAITKANGDKTNVIVISIPDYAYTSFGSGNSRISEDLDRYNNFAQTYCATNNISYVYITDITRQGLNNPELVAIDGLHPSALAYSKFVERILPIAIEKL